MQAQPRSQLLESGDRRTPKPALDEADIDPRDARSQGQRRLGKPTFLSEIPEDDAEFLLCSGKWLDVAAARYHLQCWPEVLE